MTDGSFPNSDVYKKIHIGIGNSSPSSEEITAFNKIVDRGWTVYVNGSQYSKKPAPPVYTDENGE